MFQRTFFPSQPPLKCRFHLSSFPIGLPSLVGSRLILLDFPPSCASSQIFLWDTVPKCVVLLTYPNCIFMVLTTLPPPPTRSKGNKLPPPSGRLFFTPQASPCFVKTCRFVPVDVPGSLPWCDVLPTLPYEHVRFPKHFPPVPTFLLSLTLDFHADV